MDTFHDVANVIVSKDKMAIRPPDIETSATDENVSLKTRNINWINEEAT